MSATVRILSSSPGIWARVAQAHEEIDAIGRGDRASCRKLPGGKGGFFHGLMGFAASLNFHGRFHRVEM